MQNKNRFMKNILSRGIWLFGSLTNMQSDSYNIKLDIAMCNQKMAFFQDIPLLHIKHNG